MHVSTIALALALFVSHGVMAAIRTAEELNATSDDDFARGMPFEISGTVLARYDRADCLVEGVTARIRFSSPDAPPPTQGDIVRISGTTTVMPRRQRFLTVTNSTILGHVALPPPRNVTIAQILGGECCHQAVLTQGMVAEAFPDPTDARYAHLFLSDGSAMIDVAFSASELSAGALGKLVNATVRIGGVCHPNMDGWRTLSSPFVSGTSMEITSPAPDDPFLAIPLDTRDRFNAAAASQCSRRRLDGRVMAVWHGNSLLVSSASGTKAKVTLACGVNPPSCGDDVCVVGYVGTDTANIILTSAIWRHAHVYGLAEERPRPIDEAAFHSNAVCSRYDTCLVKANATVLTVTDGNANRPQELGATIGSMPIKLILGFKHDNLSGIRPGSAVEATGVFLVETETWSRQTPFPHITGYAIVMRTPDDLRVLHQPSWWTIRRLATAAGALALLSILVIIWNALLQRTAARKGRALMKSQLKQVEAEFKSEERMRLALELHDSLAQNLTGIAFEIDTANRISDSNPEKAHGHLRTASESLRSCRDELRNCIWDLRHQTLEAETMDAAIRQTLAPHVGGVELAVRFNVLRSTFLDTTAHTVLRIIRELSINAIRHGKATAISIAGSMEGDKVKFSVRDNGCGFDPDNCPGDEQGHYGLLGVRERINTYEGTLKIESAQGRGAKVTVWLTLPHEDFADHEDNQK